MARSINVAGFVPFRVALNPNPSSLTTFVRALVTAGARLSHTRRTSPTRWEAWVWIRPGYVGLFETTAQAVEFEFVPAEKMSPDGGPLDR